MHVAASCVNPEQHRWSKVKRIASKRRSVMAPTDGRTDGCTRLYTWLVLSYEKLVVNRGEPSEVNTRASAAVGADITVTAAAGVGLLFARPSSPRRAGVCHLFFFLFFFFGVPPPPIPPNCTFVQVSPLTDRVVIDPEEAARIPGVAILFRIRKSSLSTSFTIAIILDDSLRLRLD